MKYLLKSRGLNHFEFCFGQNTSTFSYQYDITVIAYGNGKFVAEGFYYNNDNKTATSSDGVTWTNAGDNIGFLAQAIAYGNSKFVAVSPTIYTKYSTDGVTWTAGNNTGITSTFAIAYGNGKFVAGGGGGVVTSTNGATWTYVDLNSTFGIYHTISAIAWGNGKFVAGSANGKMAYSSN